MKKWWIWLLLIGGAAGAADFEAESGVLSPGTGTALYQNASGGTVVRLTGKSQVKMDAVDPAKPDCAVSFSVDRSGTWKITAVVCTEHTGNDSMYYRVDEEGLQALHTGFPKKLAPVTLGVFALKKGSHTLKLYRREPDFGLDKISVERVASKPVLRTFPGKKGPDATYFLPAVPGNYFIRIRAVVDEPGPQRNARITINDQRPVTRRIIFPTVTKGQYEVERVAVTEKPLKLRIETDPEVTITHVQLEPVKKRLPQAAVDYVPPMTPRADRPRLFINRESLEKIRRNIRRSPSHKQAWKMVEKTARNPFKFAPVPGKEVQWDQRVINAMLYKALYSLVTGDEKIGREACDLAVAYMKVVNFGNGQDVCRRTGEAIRVASMVYDWCYPVMTDGERRLLRDRFLWQAESMEIGWPPFLQHINIGHGNEAQLNKDLLSMAIAVYNEDPLPWQYCTYRLLEEARPMKSYLYKSGFHYEGIAYGTVRYGADVTAAFLLKQAAGFDQFEPYVGKVPYAWFHWRLPNGDLFRNGDDYMQGTSFPGSSEIYLAANALWPDPKLKSGYMEYFRRTVLPFSEPFYYLAMMQDGDQLQDDRRDDLPTVKFFGELLSMLSARTGWAYGLASDDVLVQMTGAGIHHSSHQHHDAGSFQLYYRGMLAADIGQYRYFGKPYDMDFAKSSMSHSVMRIIDPQQKEPRWRWHRHLKGSGIQEVPPYGPAVLEDITKRRHFYTAGETLSVSQDPAAPHLQLELSAVYPGRVKCYVRTMVFAAAENPALIVLDEMAFPRQDIRPVWQLTTFDKPVVKDAQLVAEHCYLGMPSRLTVTTLLPRKHEIKILSGKEAHKVLGIQYDPPYKDLPGAFGSRTEISAAQGESNARFLHILQPTPGTKPAPVSMTEKDGVITLVSEGWQVVLTPGKPPVCTVTKPRKAFVPPKDTVYMNGQEVCKLTDGKVPLVWLLNAGNIPWQEKNGILYIGDDLVAAPEGCDDAPEDAVTVAQKNGMWVVTPAEATTFTGTDLTVDTWNNCYFLVSHNRRSVLRSVSISKPALHGAWQELLDRGTGSVIGSGKTVATATFKKPQLLAGVSIRYLYGEQRYENLRIDVSEDGEEFKTVFDGRSSGKSNGFEDFKFPAQKVHTLRFHFNGNSMNDWNNLSGLQMIFAE